MQNNFLNSMKKLGIVLGVPLALILMITGLITIYNFLTLPKSQLVATVEFTKFVLPSGITEIIQQTKQDEAKKSAYSYDFYRSDLCKYNDIAGMWLVRITNNGTIACKNIRIKIPNALMAMINEAKANIDSNGMIEVGELGAKDDKQLVVWTRFSPSVYDSEKVLLTHENGVGKALVKLTVNPFLSNISKNSLLYIGIGFMVFGFTASILSAIQGYKASRRE